MDIKTLKQIINDNGATLRKNGNIATYKHGYQVSKKDCYILDLNNTKKILQNINDLLKTINKTDFVGLWIEKNQIYIDISTRILSKKFALSLAKNLNQISIFDWQNKNCLYIKY